ncbi:hypothetical protein [Buttiauxella sp. A111]|uniref:hypothetical protein n=1 Tax=Buttiauxella sp. A111 TaxID=2563088 RepID=UPI0010DFC973|nr:hypothetical protein [Buttiauxella sp. A111]GDX06331.1 hypothetical protein BSPA111_25400 [Buttiauxella sp. A111]
MLKKAEREALLTFLGFHDREFRRSCFDYGVSLDRIKAKVRMHKTEENKFRARPLTIREQATLSGLLLGKKTEFTNWCNTFEVSIDALRNAVKGMITSAGNK